MCKQNTKTQDILPFPTVLVYHNSSRRLTMKKCILFKGEIETLEYFSLELAKTFTEHGISVFIFDFLKEEESFEQLKDFCKGTPPIMITFNFTGIRGDDIFYDKDGNLYWNTHKIPCINIVVDHPFYYDKLLGIVPDSYWHISIDRQHEAYMKHFYPQIKLLPFLPLGGTPISDTPLSIKERSTNVVFTGNYTPPKTFDVHIERLGDEYTAFYHGIIDDLIANPTHSMEEVMESHLLKEMGCLSNNELRTVMANMIFIDLYVRFYYRGLIIKTLAEHGIPIHLYGSGWEKLECSCPENLIMHGFATSHECLQAISQSKISLNIMPWFKDGAHDRIFNSQLNGAVCLTDDSIYLREQLVDEEDCVFYSLKDIEHLPELIKDLLDNEEKMAKIADRGYKTACASHTWKKRAEVLICYINKLDL